MARPRHPSYSNSKPRPQERFAAPIAADDPEGLVSASLVVVTVVSIVIGAVVGLLLGELFPSGSRFIAIPAGFIATVVAGIARYRLIALGARVDAARIPVVLVVSAAIASIAGSLAAHDLMGFVGAQTSPGLLGAFAGLLSAMLTALLMITYHTNPVLTDEA
jgi:hypothetical protein